MSWEFVWANVNQSGELNWRSRTYVAPTLEAACDKLVNWIQKRPFEIAVDYEARAVHVKRYNSKKHDVMYPRIDTLNHEIAEYVY